MFIVPLHFLSVKLQYYVRLLKLVRLLKSDFFVLFKTYSIRLRIYTIFFFHFHTRWHKDSSTQIYAAFTNVSFQFILGKPGKLLFNCILIGPCRTPISKSRKWLKEKLSSVFSFYCEVTTQNLKLHNISRIFWI